MGRPKGTKMPTVDTVIDLRSQGIEPSEVLDREEAIALGYFVEDTDRTRVVQFKGKVIEIDWRKQVSASGQKIVWIPSQSPNFIAAGKRVVAEGKLVRPKGKKSIGAILRKFMDAPVSKRELNNLPDKIKSDLTEFMGGELTRGDIAAFALMGRAMEGDIMAFKEIADRVEGKAVQRNENKNVNVNYTDFLKGLGGFEEEDDEDPYIDV